jgi:predicted AAA+ superfamily ATPase
MFANELLQNGVEQAQIQFLNFEDLDMLAIGDIYQIHTHIKERLVDSLYIKKNCDIYITGSNAYLLSGELATLLTGRYITTSILPLQFAEYYDFIVPKPPNRVPLGTQYDYNTDR